MSLIQRISDLTTRVATEFKSVKNIITGNVSGSLSALTTTVKTSILAAINSVKADVDTKEPLIGYTTQDISEKGQANGYAPLDANAKIPAAHLPAYVDDVLEADDFTSLPASGEESVIYVTLDDNLTYRWTGSGYVEISKSLALGETSSSAYRGDRGKIAFDHSQIKDANPHETTFDQLLAKPTTVAGFGITDSFTKTEIGDVTVDHVAAFESALL